MQPLLFLDIETTGHEPLKRFGHLALTRDRKPRTLLEPWHEIIEIGALWVDPHDFHVIQEFEEKIAPKFPERCLPDLINHYPERAARGEWKGVWSLEIVLTLFLAKCGHFERSHLVGQNFFFDWTFLTVALAQCGITEAEVSKVLHYKKMDTASMAVQALLGEGELYDPANFSLRSGRLQEVLGIKPEPLPHTALNGAYQAYNVFVKLQELKRRVMDIPAPAKA